MTTAGTRSDLRVAACAIALATLFASAIGGAAAAGATDVDVSIARDALDTGETTTVDVVVTDADEGVGALNATVVLSNPDVASVQDATIHGDPGLGGVEERDDGVELSAALADTEDTGRVTVATITLRAETPGRTAVDVEVRALGDENGAAYAVGDVGRPVLAVDGDSRSTDPGDRETVAAGVESGFTEEAAGADGGGTRETAEGGPAEASTATSPPVGEAESVGTSATLLSSPVVPMGAIGAALVGVLALHRYR